jgi:carbamoyl-phosphate synthase large subunit
MNTIKILFLASNWRVSLIKAFHNSKAPIELICADSDPLASSFKEANRFQTLPRFSESNCLQSLLEICKAEKVSALVPLTNKAIEFMADHRHELGADGRRLWIPQNYAIQICHDKWELFEFLMNEEFDTPSTFLPGKIEPQFPIIAKPRQGEGSKKVFVIENSRDLEFYMKKYPQHVFQKQIDGQEFSVDTFFDQQGQPRLIVPRERLEVRGGEVMVSRINMDTDIIDKVIALGTRLGLTGPCTIQGIQDDKFYFTDLNLRFGSGFVHTISSGGNVPLMMYKELVGEELDSMRLDIKDHSIMTRYPESIFH